MCVSMLVLLLGYGFAQEETDTFCDGSHPLELVGNKNYLVGEHVNLVPSELLSGTTVVHILYKGDTVITRVDAETFISTIQYPGNYSLQTTLSLDECKQVINTPLMVYQDVVNIIGTVDSKILEPYKNIFEQKSTLVNTIPLSPE